MDYSGLPLSKGLPASIARHQRKAEKAKALTDAYTEVDARDGSFCWVTGWYTQPGHPERRCRREHHHLKGRRVRPDWVTKPERIITVCALAHELIELGFIQVEGDDARKPIRFHWREDVPQSQRIIPIRSRRWSQQDV